MSQIALSGAVPLTDGASYQNLAMLGDGDSAGTDPAAPSYAYRPYTVRTAGTRWRLVWVGSFLHVVPGGSADFDNPTAQTRKAAVQLGDTRLPVTFGGARIGVLHPGAVLVSDPFDIELEPGTVLGVHELATGGRLKLNHHSDGTQGVRADTDLVDVTDPLPPYTGFLHGPDAIYGEAVEGSAAPLLGIGDSNLTYGVMDSLSRELGRGVLNLACGGQTAYLDAAPGVHLRRFSLIAPGSLPVFGHGTNDAWAGGTVGEVGKAWVTLWTQARDHGCLPGVQLTVPPRANVEPEVVERVRTYDRWLRDGCPLDPATLTYVPTGTARAVRCDVFDQSGARVLARSGGPHLLDRVVDVAAAATNQDGGWATGWSEDGVHYGPHKQDELARVILASGRLPGGAQERGRSAGASPQEERSRTASTSGAVKRRS